MLLIICLNFWSALNGSGSCTRWSLQVPSKRNSLFQSILFCDQGDRVCSKERAQLSLHSDYVMKTSHKLLTEHDRSDYHNIYTKQFLPHSMSTVCVRRDGNKGGRSCSRAGDFEQFPDGTGTVCFICLMEKVDLSFQPFRKGFFSLSWKCLTSPGSFLPVTHEIKIFINSQNFFIVSSAETGGQ